MIKGVRDPFKLADLAHHQIKASRKQLYDALHFRLTDHHRFMLRLYLRQHDAWRTRLQRSISRSMLRFPRWTRRWRPLRPPFAPDESFMHNTKCQRFGGENHPRRNQRMGRFPTAGQLLAWAGMRPGQNESAGKRKSSRLRKGSPSLKTLLVQCGWAASRKKDSYYKAQFNRLRGRHGAKKAICAGAASMLTVIYHMLKNGTEHRDLGANQFDRRSTEIKARRLAAQIASWASRSRSCRKPHNTSRMHRSSGNPIIPKDPMPEVRSWVRARQIAWAKSGRPRL
jgi:transposase